MPVRLRITLLFGCIVFCILLLVCASVYYFYFNNRVENIRTRLTNRAITTGRLMSQADVFDYRLLQRIDTSTTLAMRDKNLQVYDYLNNKVYEYNEVFNDSVMIEPGILDDARVKNNIYFTIGKKDAVALHYVDKNARLVIVAAAFDEDGLKKLSQLRVILVTSFLGGIIVAFAAGYFFSKRLLVPVKNIADDINEISAQDLTRRINTGSVPDEWYYLSDTINNLLNRLEEGFEMQRRFIANASHELCTPLTSISSQLEVFLQKDRDNYQYRQVMESVHQDVRHLNKLTQTLLEFAQASGNRGGLEILPVRIDELLMRLPAEVKRTDEQYSVILSFDSLPEEEDKLVVTGNSELLFSAVNNIISNACKYSSDHTAEVKLLSKTGQVIIEVHDRGIGIPEAELKNIFHPFYRATNKGEGGFGLGLSLAHRIIKLHNGQILAQSHVGEGSTFTIILPNANF